LEALVCEFKLVTFPASPSFFVPSIHPHAHMGWASAVQRHIHSLLFPSLFIPIFSLFCGFEIPIRRILQKKFLRYSQCIKIESEISSFPLRLCRQGTLKNSVCDLRRFRSQSVHFYLLKLGLYRDKLHVYNNIPLFVGLH
jgi:hypothetical protein